MMSFTPLTVGIGLLGGIVLGCLYFGGLWLSVKRLKETEHKKRFLLLSWFVRSVLLCLGLYLMARFNAASLLCAAAGLFISRSVIIRSVKRKMAGNKTKEIPVC